MRTENGKNLSGCQVYVLINISPSNTFDIRYGNRNWTLIKTFSMEREIILVTVRGKECKKTKIKKLETRPGGSE